MTEPDSQDYTVRSVTITETMDADGNIGLTIDTEGDPSQWDIIGMLDYAQAAERRNATWPEDED